MKLFLLAVAALVLVQSVQSENPKVYEDIDIVAILNDEPTRKSFYACVVGKIVPCSPKEEHLKPILIDMYLTNCAKCTEWQNDQYNKGLQIMKERYPDKLKAAEELIKANARNSAN